MLQKSAIEIRIIELEKRIPPIDGTGVGFVDNGLHKADLSSSTVYVLLQSPQIPPNPDTATTGSGSSQTTYLLTDIALAYLESDTAWGDRLDQLRDKRSWIVFPSPVSIADGDQFVFRSGALFVHLDPIVWLFPLADYPSGPPWHPQSTHDKRFPDGPEPMSARVSFDFVVTAIEASFDYGTLDVDTRPTMGTELCRDSITTEIELLSHGQHWSQVIGNVEVKDDYYPHSPCHFVRINIGEGSRVSIASPISALAITATIENVLLEFDEGSGYGDVLSGGHDQSRAWSYSHPAGFEDATLRDLSLRISSLIFPKNLVLLDGSIFEK